MSERSEKFDISDNDSRVIIARGDNGVVSVYVSALGLVPRKVDILWDEFVDFMDELVADIEHARDK